MSEWILVLSLTYDRPYSRILFESRDSLLLNFYIPITEVLFRVSHIAFVTASPWMYYIPQKSILPFFFFLSLVLLLFLLFLLLLLCCFILYPLQIIVWAYEIYWRCWICRYSTYFYKVNGYREFYFILVCVYIYI